MYGLFIILLMVVAMNSGCSPAVIPTKTNVVGYDQVKYDMCFKRGQKDGMPMSRVIEECREYAEINNSPEKEGAKAICVERKLGEIGWLKWEIDRYCTRFWRGYR